MICEQCGTQYGPEPATCPACGDAATPGSAASEAAPPPSDSDRELELMLTRANLHRIRNEPKDSSRLCLEIIRRDPKNAPARALLGDLHAEFGEWAEAQYWYREAIALEPEVVRYQEKLSRVVDELQARSPAHGEPQPAPDDETVASDLPWQKKALPLGLAAAAGLTLILVTFGIGQMTRRLESATARRSQPARTSPQTESTTAVESSGEATVVPDQPEGETPTPAAATEKPAPVPVPAPAPDRSAPAEPEETAPSVMPPASPDLSRWTATERHVMDVLQAAVAEEEEKAYAVYDVSFDPTVGTLMLTFESPTADIRSEEAQAKVVARAKSLAARAAAELPEASILTLRAAVDTGRNLSLVFVGVTTRVVLTDPNEETVFVPKWWAE